MELLDTIMLFRCTTLDYAERFMETGNIRFGMPKEWIDYYKKHGDGRGDLLEGSFASLFNFDKRAFDFCKTRRTNVSVTQDERTGIYYFQSNDVLALRTFCLFGLNKSLFSEILEGEDRKLYPTGIIPKKYFEDFSNINQENYDNLPKSEKPVLLMINNPHKFFERLKHALLQYGFEQDEFVIQPVNYIDKHNQFLIGDIVPGELFVKDSSFDYQSEIRVVLMPRSSKIIKKLEKVNGIFDLGSMRDIASIYDYYFHDFHMQLRNNSILFTLPKPEFTPITDPLTIISYIHQIYRDEEPGGLLNIQDRDELVDKMAELLKSKFAIKFNMETLTFTSEDGQTTWVMKNVWETLYNQGFSYYIRGEYDKSIDQYTKAILIDSKRPDAWWNRAVSYYKKGDFSNMLSDMNQAIILDPNNQKYITERNEQLKIHDNR